MRRMPDSEVMIEGNAFALLRDALSVNNACAVTWPISQAKRLPFAELCQHW